MVMPDMDDDALDAAFLDAISSPPDDDADWQAAEDYDDLDNLTPAQLRELDRAEGAWERRPLYRD